jgi:pimeloyl-ACP methyl ester carboxylesterase
VLHGFPQTKRSWANVIPALAAAGHRVIAPDLRGYSPGARQPPYDVRTLVADVLAFTDAPQFDLVGHDWGAAIAWQTAIRHPERIRTLTVVSVPHPLAFTHALRTDPDQQRRSQYMRDWSAGDAPDLQPPGDRASAAAIAAGVEYYKAQSAQDLEGIGPVTVPTLHVWSTEDPALGRVATELTAEHVTGPYRLEIFEGVDHWIPEREPERLGALILEHVECSRD